MTNYKEGRVKLTNTHQIKICSKKQNWDNMRITYLQHRLFLILRQKNEVKNAFANNLSMDIKLSKFQLSKIIQPAGFLSTLSDRLIGSLMKVAAPVVNNVLAPLAAMAWASATDGAIQRKICGLGVVVAEKGIILVISNKDMDDIILKL